MYFSKTVVCSALVLFILYPLSPFYPLAGMFIAKISRGRTIRQFINGTLTAPVVYSFMWMILFGGIGIRHERAANEVCSTWLRVVLCVCLT